MPVNVREAKKMIDQWAGRDILLTKEEDGDIDQTVMTLENASIVERKESIDDYVSPTALQLHGEGYVIFDGERQAPLPNNAYDIPLTDNVHMHAGENTLFIETERAKYSVANVLEAGSTTGSPT